VQRKLRVGDPDDPFERHADEVAERVMRSAATAPGPIEPPPPPIQRKCQDCEDEQVVRLSRGQSVGAASPDGATPAPGLDAQVSELGGGVPLPASERAFFEPRFGFDFGAVRVHADAQAAQAAQALRAEAFTVGAHIAFNTGRYVPGDLQGRRLLAHELTHVIQQAEVPSRVPGVQRTESETPAAESGTPATAGGALLVDDAATPAEGQMRKTAFLAQLREAVCSTAAAELASTQWSAAGCPWLDRWFDYYADKDAAHIERALRRYAPDAAAARTASDYIPIFCQRVRQGIQRWSKTGELPDLPEGIELPGGGVLGAIGGALSAVGSAVSSVVSAIGSAFSAIGNLFTKRREGASATATSVDDSRRRLGDGEVLDGGVRSRMERALGHDFSTVRVHRGAAAGEVSAAFGARALTIGNDIAFGGGEYRPGTPVGDVLLAHELAHVVQQRALGGRAVTGDVAALERDADRTAAATALSLWSGGKTSARIAPALGARPSLQRCVHNTGPTTTTPAPAPFNEPGGGISMTPAMDPAIDVDVQLSTGSWGYSLWSVTMTLPSPATTRGWLIQHIQQNTDVRHSDNTPDRDRSHQYEFWEPLSPISQNATTSGRRADDNYGSLASPDNSRGTVTTVGRVKFYTGTLPNNVFNTNDAELARFGETGPLTRTRPSWWDDTGTDHNLTVTWNWTGANEPTRMHGVAGTRVVDYPSGS
jgi:hypothetical protein